MANTRCRTEHENGKVRVTRVASLGKLLSCRLRRLFRCGRQKFDADLIHVHLANPLAELSALLANRDIPVVAHFHSDVVRPLPAGPAKRVRTLSRRVLPARQLHCRTVAEPY